MIKKVLLKGSLTDHADEHRFNPSVAFCAICEQISFLENAEKSAFEMKFSQIKLMKHRSKPSVAFRTICEQSLF